MVLCVYFVALANCTRYFIDLKWIFQAGNWKRLMQTSIVRYIFYLSVIAPSASSLLKLPLLPRKRDRFLDASSHLYKRVCPSVGGSVIRFFLLQKIKVFLHVCHQGVPGTSQKCRIASLQIGMSVDPSVCLRIKLKKKK